MSKADQTATKQKADQQIATNNANAGVVGSQLNSTLGTAQSNAAGLLPGITSGYADISTTGGYDPAQLNTINNTFGDLATTGGISGADQVSMQNRAAEAAKSAYSTGADAASRSAAATGGYGATGGAIQADLARKGSQAAATAVEDTNASITGMRQAGQVAGATGLNTTQQNQVGNKLAGLGGQSNIYGMNEAQATQTIGQIMQNYQQTGSLNNQDLSILTNLANQPGMMDKIMQWQLQLSEGFKDSAQGASSIIGAVGGGGCWIAESVYGVNDLRTHLIRKYLNGEFKQTLGGKIIMFFYLLVGKQIAKIVRKSNTLQVGFKYLFDSLLYN